MIKKGKFFLLSIMVFLITPLIVLAQNVQFFYPLNDTYLISDSYGIQSERVTWQNSTPTHLVEQPAVNNTAFNCSGDIIGIGGDPAIGTRMVEVLRLLREDKQTEVVLIVGEIGGVMEEEVAGYIGEEKFSKPVAAFIAGRIAPSGKRMGHAGAIIMGDRGTAGSKISVLNRVGIPVAKTLSEIPSLVRGML